MPDGATERWWCHFQLVEKGQASGPVCFDFRSSMSEG